MEPPKKFTAGPAERIIRDVLEHNLDNNTHYDPIQTSHHTKLMAQEIKDRVKRLGFQRWEFNLVSFAFWSFYVYHVFFSNLWRKYMIKLQDNRKYIQFVIWNVVLKQNCHTIDVSDLNYVQQWRPENLNMRIMADHHT